VEIFGASLGCGPQIGKAATRFRARENITPEVCSKPRVAAFSAEGGWGGLRAAKTNIRK